MALPENPTVEQFFDQFIRSPRVWVDSAHELRAAGLLVFSRAEEEHRAFVESWKAKGPPDTLSPTVEGPGLMLLGMALEVAFKGAIVRHVHLPVKETGKGASGTMPDITTHDLVSLASRAGLAVSAEERAFLRTATYAITTAGRYPAPMRASDWREVPTEYARFRALFDALWSMAIARAEEPRDGGDIPP